MRNEQGAPAGHPNNKTLMPRTLIIVTQKFGDRSRPTQQMMRKPVFERGLNLGIGRAGIESPRGLFKRIIAKVGCAGRWDKPQRSDQ